jgi:hypothetical protein
VRIFKFSYIMQACQEGFDSDARRGTLKARFSIGGVVRNAEPSSTLIGDTGPLVRNLD